jgi:hypothetical protein
MASAPVEEESESENEKHGTPRGGWRVRERCKARRWVDWKRGMGWMCDGTAVQPD